MVCDKKADAPKVDSALCLGPKNFYLALFQSAKKRDRFLLRLSILFVTLFYFSKLFWFRVSQFLQTIVLDNKHNLKILYKKKKMKKCYYKIDNFQIFQVVFKYVTGMNLLKIKKCQKNRNFLRPLVNFYKKFTFLVTS